MDQLSGQMETWWPGRCTVPWLWQVAKAAGLSSPCLGLKLEEARLITVVIWDKAAWQSLLETLSEGHCADGAEDRIKWQQGQHRGSPLLSLKDRPELCGAYPHVLQGVGFSVGKTQKTSKVQTCQAPIRAQTHSK